MKYNIEESLTNEEQLLLALLAKGEEAKANALTARWSYVQQRRMSGILMRLAVELNAEEIIESQRGKCRHANN